MGEVYASDEAKAMIARAIEIVNLEGRLTVYPNVPHGLCHFSMSGVFPLPIGEIPDEERAASMAETIHARADQFGITNVTVQGFGPVTTAGNTEAGPGECLWGFKGFWWPSDGPICPQT